MRLQGLEPWTNRLRVYITTHDFCISFLRAGAGGCRNYEIQLFLTNLFI
ncbi:hypothetical protein CLOSYM_04641 [[Clostridium] symbiosum ATCC 14940]|uniref:Uncharacterized protein n=1 Tax=[Clostridium] symbiosum ATCC 14940 TaxID=411472 RepID=A0ABC9TR34_CLOSY|nr:hypothetical protein CLOSYM_04641 [[Clostridium] symbiosum ATCC 14940]